MSHSFAVLSPWCKGENRNEGGYLQFFSQQIRLKFRSETFLFLFLSEIGWKKVFAVNNFQKVTRFLQEINQKAGFI